MTSAEFEAQLRQSVADHVALVHAAAKAAKARIGTSIPDRMLPEPAFAPAPEPVRPPNVNRPAVDFFAEEALPEVPVASLEEPAAPLPDAPISFDDFGGGNVDDEGIPVWEDPL